MILGSESGNLRDGRRPGRRCGVRTGVRLSGDKLDFIYALKTGALIEASMLIGAVLAGATENEQDIMFAEMATGCGTGLSDSG